MKKVYREHDMVIMMTIMNRGLFKSEYARKELEYLVEDFEAFLYSAVVVVL